MSSNASAAVPAGRHDVLIIGGGAAGIALAASLHKRRESLDIAIIEPAEIHDYQPGWTLVGGGVFTPEQTRRAMRDVMPDFVTWYRHRCDQVAPDAHRIVLDDGRVLGYRSLVVAPGLVIDWSAIDGLEATLGEHGVTSNYRRDLAPYTWSLVQSLSSGRALFTQPPMPIKCAGAPQKAMYLACDAWRRRAVLGGIDVSFHNAGGVLFGVADYVPALERYVEHYGIDLHYQENLVAVDGPNRVARFRVTRESGEEIVERRFDMLHVVPPQRAPDLVRRSVLADAAGWLDLDEATLQHRRYPDVFGLGDASGTGNAKTAAAVRKQAPVVAENLLARLDGRALEAGYLGYGACPLTVERGRVVLAEFGYGGKLQPTLPHWLVEGTQATRMGWMVKAHLLPRLYWNVMLKGHEWLAAPATLEKVAERVAEER
ncbi:MULTISPECIES: FAD/NAD(P)-binding oxidoreductase [unclassified Modicisalibacter]|uniref:NAD(P)/FAD-dependent oxidoreductase n=1 Tax=unclassified Modicisalibacter TaxID=2679913 RepID=UPI001CCA3F86|nr:MULTISPECIES: FAD/NAD(P)-binding oxidoreductase [unclassified Modicisalibacter]MBZ9557563.1 NAD(P)/FAD-dependent oxidoreductase [Modicisalibacter sp. R2A 31.J]MBZ9573772.1 NAD(P)/FAD-dependent oxidoreductase [Modicisalibacter sp. MOD 31.J]